MTREEKITELLMDDSFLSKVDDAENYEELSNLFIENGADISPAEVEQLVSVVAQTNKTGELNEADLENVSGGWWVAGVYSCYKAAKSGWNAGKKFSDWVYNKFGIN